MSHFTPLQLQPEYPGNTDNWYIALSQLVNKHKHSHLIHHLEYDIPIIYNGKKSDGPVPVGKPVYGSPSFNIGLIDGVEYERFNVINVARKAVMEAERIVDEFHKYL